MLPEHNYFFSNSIMNVDNILETNIYSYEKKSLDSLDYIQCNICGDESPELDEDAMVYCHDELDFPICIKCYNNLPKPSICRKCGKSFDSRNKLFKHLYENETHMIDPITFEDGKIAMVCEFDSNLFNLTLEEAKKNPFYYEYKNIFNEPFLKTVGYCKTKITIKTVRKTWVFNSIDYINVESQDELNKIDINDFVMYSKDNIGWIKWRKNYFIPIVDILIEV